MENARLAAEHLLRFVVSFQQGNAHGLPSDPGLRAARDGDFERLHGCRILVTTQYLSAAGHHFHRVNPR
jgi:hypothetical protein